MPKLHFLSGTGLCALGAGLRAEPMCLPAMRGAGVPDLEYCPRHSGSRWVSDLCHSSPQCRDRHARHDTDRRHWHSVTLDFRRPIRYRNSNYERLLRAGPGR